MDQTSIGRAASSASRSNDDDTVFHYPDGSRLPASHPGDTLADELAARGLTANALALKLRVPANRISDIVRGRRAITVETALRLQAGYDLAVAERDFGAMIAKEVDPALSVQGGDT